MARTKRKTEKHPDLFGGETRVAGPRSPNKLSPYPAQPGTGPAGETCRTCANHVVMEFGKRYQKCAYTSAHYTATDIKLKTPACAYWLPADLLGKSAEWARRFPLGYLAKLSGSQSNRSSP